MYRLIFTQRANKDAKKIAQANLKNKTSIILDILERNPFQNPPSYEKLRGDLQGAYSRRINIKHRLVYEIYQKEKLVKVLAMWSHYE